jgi:oxygen-independent coproporphyrinogen-3 oxidase
VEGPGLYLHIPFCSEICPYCDFAVLKAGPERRRRFGSQLGLESGLLAEAGSPASGLAGFDTVYLGGGTPSLLPVEELAKILAQVGERLGVCDDAWIFLEANPEDVTQTTLEGWRALGVRTLSLGVQSFDDEELSFLGRRHSAMQGRDAVERALQAGFDSVSVDLIYALPGQSLASWRRNLEATVALAPNHLSCYELTVHQGTPFARQRQRGDWVDEGQGKRGELFSFTHRFLADAGWPGYEVSNFARSSAFQSRHNRKYWSHTPYLGLGPSAHSFDGRQRRWWNERQLPAYRRKLEAGELPIAGSEVLTSAALRLEALMLALRTRAGIDRRSFENRFKVDPAASPASHRLAEQGLLQLRADRVAPTLAGLAVADTLALEMDAGLAQLS